MLPLLVSLGMLAAAGPEGRTYSGRESQLAVALPAIEARIDVDGVLDEPVWEKAARLTGFSQYAPVDGEPAEHDTEVLVWYSPTRHPLRHPRRMRRRARCARRWPTATGSTPTTRVEIFLGTFNDGRQAIVFAVNPLGVQADGALVEGTRTRAAGSAGLATGREVPDLSPDFVFESKGRLTRRKATRSRCASRSRACATRRAETQDWGINVCAACRARGHEDSWAPARRAGTSFLAQAGTLAGPRRPAPRARARSQPGRDGQGGRRARAASGWGYDSEPARGRAATCAGG